MANKFRRIGDHIYSDPGNGLVTVESTGSGVTEHSSAISLPGTAITSLTNNTGGTVSSTLADGLTFAGLTENAGAIGGTNDGDLPSLTATAATVTGTLTGSTDGTLADVAAIALSTGDVYTDADVNSAVNGAIADLNLQLKELQTALNEVIADNVALRAAVRECAAALVTVKTDLTTSNNNVASVASVVNSLLTVLESMGAAT